MILDWRKNVYKIDGVLSGLVCSHLNYSHITYNYTRCMMPWEVLSSKGKCWMHIWETQLLCNCYPNLLKLHCFGVTLRICLKNKFVTLHKLLFLYYFLSWPFFIFTLSLSIVICLFSCFFYKNLCCVSLQYEDFLFCVFKYLLPHATQKNE